MSGLQLSSRLSKARFLLTNDCQFTLIIRNYPWQVGSFGSWLFREEECCGWPNACVSVESKQLNVELSQRERNRLWASGPWRLNDTEL